MQKLCSTTDLKNLISFFQSMKTQYSSSFKSEYKTEGKGVFP